MGVSDFRTTGVVGVGWKWLKAKGYSDIFGPCDWSEKRRDEAGRSREGSWSPPLIAFGVLFAVARG
jgi:hypothetical protein